MCIKQKSKRLFEKKTKSERIRNWVAEGNQRNPHGFWFGWCGETKQLGV